MSIISFFPPFKTIHNLINTSVYDETADDGDCYNVVSAFPVEDPSLSPSIGPLSSLCNESSVDTLTSPGSGAGVKFLMDTVLTFPSKNLTCA